MSKVLVILGNQLFPEACIKKISPTHIYMAESRQFIEHGNCHKQKIHVFLSSMRRYRDTLGKLGYSVCYRELDSSDGFSQKPFVKGLESFLEEISSTSVHFFEIEDRFFERELSSWAKASKINLSIHETPMFLASRAEFKSYLDGSKKPFMKTFYEKQRRRLSYLMTPDGQPEGGKFSYDNENRKKLPKDYRPAAIWNKTIHHHDNEVAELVKEHFRHHPGELDLFVWPTDRNEALDTLKHFIENRLDSYGDYQDAISSKHDFISHSLISSALNQGLLLPGEVCDLVVKSKAPLNCKEGFVRQVIGWREFVRGIYHNYESKLFTTNHWNHKRKFTSSWFDGTLGVPPVDDAIKKTLRYGYNHHIERLMVLANFMNLCEIEPLEVYEWFMSMYVDSSDWVMAANVFGMGLMSDGGIFATKPYVSGSNYILKMSSYPRGPWCEVWNALYWRFIGKHKESFIKNPRMAMMVRQYEKQPEDKRKLHEKLAEEFLGKVTKS